MDTRIWGPAMWKACHAATFGYPERADAATMVGARAFFHGLEWIMPCDVCRTHYRALLGELPIEPHLGGRDSLARWFVEIHNRVNDRTGKHRLDFEFVRREYDAMRGTCRQEINHNAASPPCIMQPPSAFPPGAQAAGVPSVKGSSRGAGAPDARAAGPSAALLVVMVLGVAILLSILIIGGAWFLRERTMARSAVPPAPAAMSSIGAIS